MDGLPSSPPFHTRFLWIFAWHSGGVCACVGFWCAACVWSQSRAGSAARDEERGGALQGKGDGDIAALWNWREAASPACQRKFSPRQLLLFAGMCIVSGQVLYCSPLTFRVPYLSFAVCLALRDASECLAVCGRFLFLYFLSGSIVVCWLSIWLPRFFLPASSRLNSGMHS